mmetsp:Transcript_30410/g.49163  ORF Transcript_30410/g.49163 Transcript_30410/m.49163 type:complete len:698 (-) Transcript_30410:489-2582(-)
MTLQIFRRFLQVFPLVYLFVIVCFCTLLVTPELYSTPSTTFVGPPRRNIFISTSPRSDGSGSSEDGREDVCHGPGQLLLNNHREAYVTVVFEPGEGFMKAAELMAHSLRLTNTSRPIIAMVTKFVNTAVRMRLLRAGFVLHDVDPLSHPLPRCAHTRWTGNNNNSELVKMRVWELDCLDKVIYLDADMLVLQNIDSLFQKKGHPVSAVRGLKPAWGFNAGVMVLEPNKDVFADMIAKFTTVGTYDCGDQGFLNLYFKWRNLPDSYKLPSVFNTHHRVFNQMKRVDKLQTKILHFSSLKKPWDRPRNRDATIRYWWDALRHFYSQKMNIVASDQHKTRHEIVTELQEWIARVILPLIPAGAPAVILDYPDHPNVGDQAIWMGEKIFFEQHNIPLVFECASYLKGRYRYDSHDCDLDEVARKIGKDGIIFLHGGGNFRNVPNKPRLGYYQTFRHKVIQRFPNNPIVFLPQTINFESKFPEVLEEAKAVINSHSNLTLLFRDEISLAFAQMHFTNARSILCPDMAFMIGLIGHGWLGSQTIFNPSSLPPPSHKMVWIARVDAEAITDRKMISSWDSKLGIRTDWKHMPRSTKLGFNPRASDLVERGMALLAQGNVVVTDRLHGMILGYLLGRTVVAMDNNYGKVSKYYNTFLYRDPNVFWAKDEPEAQLMASILADMLETHTRESTRYPRLETYLKEDEK